ncbi:MAG TPA: hypothetical protein VM099_02195 [Gemmatimonadaceae bacterium]|nr:hypothetical protein [Gemmatimonadaceae bacterium]
MRIVVLGHIVRGPIGGMAWHHLQYVLGLARLGHRVMFVEDSDDYPSCYDPIRHVIDTDPTYGLQFAHDAFTDLGLENIWAFYDAHTAQWFGPAARGATTFCESAEIVLNISGINPLRDWTRKPRTRVLVDTDPAFTQVRNLTKEDARKNASEHNSFFTFAENVANGTARLPDDGLSWRPTRQPVVLDAWKVTRGNPSAPYTTVMQWSSYPAVEWNGIRYGTKASSFEPFFDLPSRTPAKLEIALGGAGAPHDKFRDSGWLLQNPLEVALTPRDYQNYIAQSRGELSVAKQGYVVSNSGWFSERSACYLASGRPVVTQETGFSEWLPVGEGLLSFQNGDEAANAIAEIERDYNRHSLAARRIIEEHFDARKVLSRLLSECG